MIRAWAITYICHEQKKMWGFFTLEYLKCSMHIFHTVCDTTYMDVPDGATLNHGYPVMESRTEFVTQEKKVKFLKDNKTEVDKYIYRPYTKLDQGLADFIQKARKDISYSDTTNSADILMALRRIYNRINSTQNTK